MQDDQLKRLDRANCLSAWAIGISIVALVISVCISGATLWYTHIQTLNFLMQTQVSVTYAEASIAQANAQIQILLKQTELLFFQADKKSYWRYIDSLEKTEQESDAVENRLVE